MSRFLLNSNKKGLIFPEKVVSNLVDQGITQVDFLLELSFREREPYDSTVVEVLKDSVNFWRTCIKN